MPLPVLQRQLPNGADLIVSRLVMIGLVLSIGQSITEHGFSIAAASSAGADGSNLEETIYVIGLVMQAGKYDLEPAMTVSDAISRAGGLAPRGRTPGGSTSAQVSLEIRRRTSRGKQILKARMSDPLVPNDMVVVWREEEPKKQID